MYSQNVWVPVAARFHSIVPRRELRILSDGPEWMWRWREMQCGLLGEQISSSRLMWFSTATTMHR